MDTISFHCSKVEILEKIKQLRSLVRPKSKKSLMAATLEIRIQPQFVSFHISGGELKLFCNTKGWGSFTLSVYSSNADPSSSHPDPLRAGRSNLNSGILTPPFFATVGRVISMN